MEQISIISDDEDMQLSEILSDNEIEDDAVGIIKRLSVTNFMCHDNLTVEFQGNVNFIIGNNGSGKSALFTALIIGLGGHMSSTNRGTSIKSLIKDGSSYALIEITLINQAGILCKDIYGKRVQVERKIHRDGHSTFKLKNQFGRVLKTKKQDILNILEEFNFQVDNPLTFLDQEQSKSLLISNNERDRYKFFEKSTLLDEVVKKQKETEATKRSIIDLIQLKQGSLNDLEADYNKKKKELRNHVSTEELRDSLDTWNKKLAWSYVVNLENKRKDIEKKLRQAEKTSSSFFRNCNNYAEKEEHFQKKIEQSKVKMENAKEDLNKVVDELKNISKCYQASKKSFRNENIQYDATVSNHKKLSTSFKMFKSKIENKKQVHIGEIDGLKEYEASRIRLQTLKKEVEKIRLEVETIDKNMNEVTSALEKLKCENRSLTSDEQSLKDQITSNETNINNMVASKKNRLRLFGTKMPDLVKMIEDGYKRGRFSQLPRGPIGNCISITDPSLILPVESVVCKFLFSFVVASQSDEKVLKEMMNSVFNRSQVSKMAIYIMKFGEKLHDVTRFRTTHPKYSTVYDLLKVNDVNVMNCLIDWAHIENILIIPDLNEAIDCIQVQKWDKCTKAITSKGDEVYVRKFYSNEYSSKTSFLGEDIEEGIRKHRKKINSLQDSLKKVRGSITALQSQSNMKMQSLNQMKMLKVDLVKKMKEVRLEISKLELMEKPVEMNWEELEEEILLYEHKLKKEKDELIRVNSQRQATKLKLTEIKRNFESMEETVRDRNEIVNSLSEEHDILLDQLNKLKSDQNYCLGKYDEHKTLVAELKKKFELVSQEVECCSAKARQVSEERPDIEEPTEDIIKTISATQENIKRREKTVGDYDKILEEVKTAKKLYHTARSQIQNCSNQLKKIEEILTLNLTRQMELVNLLATQFTFNFMNSVEAFNLKGSVNFDHTKKLLQLEVSQRGGVSGNEMKFLSGGERSFSTVCFIMSLWKIMYTPLRCLDEFDVFMDIDNRRMAIEILLGCAKTQPNVQFIFLTPNEISNLSGDHKVQVWKMPDPERHKRAR